MSIGIGIGIDYGMGQTNRDATNGIRYGVIAQGSVGQAWYDLAEAYYGEPTCPKCGKAAVEYGDEHEEFKQDGDFGCADYACIRCEISFDSSEAYSEEPLSYSYSGDGYKLEDCLDFDIMVLKSPFYTHAPFCSPCVPGAGDLDNADPDGVKTYCLGHDWFEEGKAPYPVYSVADDSLVPAPNG